MTYQREKEKKFVLTHERFAPEVWIELLRLFPEHSSLLVGTSIDTFWNQPGVDFIRLRKNTSELTVKITDQSTIEDRVEENIECKDYDTARRFANAVFGPEVGTFEKNYFIIYVEKAVVSLYTVTGRPEIYLEVESDDMFHVNAISSFLKRHFEMQQEMRSLYQIVFNKEAA